jgi:hypothetical protein
MSGVYLTGKKEKHTLPARPSRLAMIKVLVAEIEPKILELLKFANTHKSEYSDQPELLEQFDKLTNKTLEIFSKTLQSKHKVRATLREEILLLRKMLKVFDEKYIANFKFQDATSSNFLHCVEALTESIDDFIVHFDTVCDFIWYGDTFNFKTSEREKKVKFFNAVIEYRRIHKTQKFAPYFWILKLAGLDEESLPPRTYGLWKKQWEQGTFHHYVQPQERFRQ